MSDDRANSPEYSEDYEYIAAQRRARRQLVDSQREEERLDAIEEEGNVAAWRSYPELPTNPYRADSPEGEAFAQGACSSYEWAKVHEEEGWHRVVDGQEVRP